MPILNRDYVYFSGRHPCRSLTYPKERCLRNSRFCFASLRELSGVGCFKPNSTPSRGNGPDGASLTSPIGEAGDFADLGGF